MDGVVYILLLAGSAVVGSPVVRGGGGAVEKVEAHGFSERCQEENKILTGSFQCENSRRSKHSKLLLCPNVP